jgi:hypothetical protein
MVKGFLLATEGYDWRAEGEQVTFWFSSHLFYKLLKIPIFEKKNRMSFTRIALETHDTHMSMGVTFYWLASKNFTGSG